MKWRALIDPALHLRSWNNEFIVYNHLSGDTHLLGLAAAEILQLIHHSPSDASSLTKALAVQWQADLDDQISAEIDTILADLESLALIERA